MLRGITVLQVIPLVTQAVAEAVTAVFHARGVEVPAALEFINSVSACALAVMLICLVLADRTLYQVRPLAPSVSLSIGRPAEETDSDPDVWTQWREVQAYPSVSSADSHSSM